MSNHKTTRDESMVNEAAKIIKGLREHQKNSTEKFSQIDKQIGDLEKANRLLTESVQTLPVESVGGDERLKSFIEKDGKIRWETKTAKVSVPGKGNFHVEEEGLLDSKVPANEWHRELIKIAQERAFVRMVMPEHNPSTPKSDLKLYRHLQKHQENFKVKSVLFQIMPVLVLNGFLISLFLNCMKLSKSQEVFGR